MLLPVVALDREISFFDARTKECEQEIKTLGARTKLIGSRRGRPDGQGTKPNTFAGARWKMFCERTGMSEEQLTRIDFSPGLPE